MNYGGMMRGASVLLAFVALLGAHDAVAQTDVVDPSRPLLSRDALQQLLVDLEALATTGSDSAREDANRRLQLVRARLGEGDFQAGDRVSLVVEEEPELSDTFTVDIDRALPLPVVGDLPLTGVLRFELQDHVTEYLGRFIRNPRVQASALLRIGVIGAVGQPGFYTLASEDPITSVIMTAGGPLSDARMEEIRIERGGDIVWEGAALQGALQQGATLDQMSLRPGDQITIPQQGATLATSESLLRTVALLLSIPLAIAAVVALF